MHLTSVCKKSSNSIIIFSKVIVIMQHVFSQKLHWLGKVDDTY